MSEFKECRCGRRNSNLIDGLCPLCRANRGDVSEVEPGEIEANGIRYVQKDAAMRLCEVYFDIASDVLGVEEVRRRRDAAITADAAGGGPCTCAREAGDSWECKRHPRRADLPHEGGVRVTFHGGIQVGQNFVRADDVIPPGTYILVPVPDPKVGT